MARKGASDMAHLDEPDLQALQGPFTTPQLLRLDHTLRHADEVTGLTFSVYVGELDEPTRSTAEQMLHRMADPAHSVLIAVSPNQRVVEVVTGAQARRRVSDRECSHAAKSMTAAFNGGDLAGGLVIGVAQLADHAGQQQESPTRL